jgi:hypothetical protein
LPKKLDSLRRKIEDIDFILMPGNFNKNHWFMPVSPSFVCCFGLIPSFLVWSQVFDHCLAFVQRDYLLRSPEQSRQSHVRQSNHGGLSLRISLTEVSHSFVLFCFRRLLKPTFKKP